MNTSENIADVKLHEIYTAGDEGVLADGKEGVPTCVNVTLDLYVYMYLLRVLCDAS